MVDSPEKTKQNKTKQKQKSNKTKKKQNKNKQTNKQTNASVRHFKSLSKFVSHESGIHKRA